MRRCISWMVLLVLSVGLLSCSSDPTAGYSANSVYPTQIRSVAVPIFTSKSFVRDVDFELTDALIKEIEAR